MRVASRRLQHNFSKVAGAYDARAQFQHVETRRVLDAALMIFPPCVTIADIGCGTGYFAAASADKRPEWKLIGIDIAMGMCQAAAARFTVMQGDAAQLPLADASVEAAVSSLCYQWVEKQPQAFSELYRVLKPGGRAVIATLGETTLQELRGAAEAVELPLGLLPMHKFDASKTLVQASGFEITFAERRVVTQYYANVTALLDSMRAIGAGNNFANSERGFIGPKRWASMVAQYEKHRTTQGIPATWEHQFFILHKPL